MSGQAVVVTGASTGIGRACALMLDRQGWQVFAGVRREQDGQELAGMASPRLHPLMLDVTDTAAIDRAFAEVAEATGDRGLAGLVNNAGIAVGGPLEYLPLAKWREQFEVNVIGQVTVTKAAMPLLRKARGTIVFIGSNSGRIGTPMMAPYCGSKFAVGGIADSLRMELHGSGVGVSVVEPGAVSTPIWEKGRALADELEQQLPPEGMSRYRDQVAAVRKGIDQQERDGVPPEKVAETVLKALTAARPRARYQVGLDSTLSVVLARSMPDRVKDAVIRRLLKP